MNSRYTNVYQLPEIFRKFLMFLFDIGIYVPINPFKSIWISIRDFTKAFISLLFFSI